MRAYSIRRRASFGDSRITQVRYAGSQADAKARRDEIVDLTGCKKSEVVIMEIEIPTRKHELLDFINNACRQFDA